VLGAAFVRHERRRPDPAVDLRLFRDAAFTAPLLTNAAAFFVLYGTQYALAQYMQLVLGLPPLEAAVWTVPSSVGHLLGSVLGPPAARRVRPAFVVAAGLVLAVVGFGLLTQVGAGLVVLVAGTVVFSVGLAPVYLADHRHDRLGRAGGPGRQRLGDLRDGRRAGRRARRRRAGQHRRGRLPVRDGHGAASGGSAEPLGRRAGTLGGAVAAAEHLPDGPAAQLVAAVAAAVALRGVRS
jgi:DHA2 family multidrug resistance protein-like MFS transporter